MRVPKGIGWVVILLVLFCTIDKEIRDYISNRLEALKLSELV